MKENNMTPKMKEEYDFTKADRGKFYHPDLELQITIYLDPDVAQFIEALAEKKKTNQIKIVNELLRKNMQLIKSVS